MKYNKIYLGLGVLAVSLASCSEDVEYTPAAAVNTPPVYFSMNDESAIDLEEGDTYFTIKVYRQNTASAGEYKLNATVSNENGTPVPAGLFRICEPKKENGEVVKDEEGNIVYEDYNKGTPLDGQAELSAEFAADSGETGIRIDFGSTDNLVEKEVYKFDVKASGESSPYFITNRVYDVCFMRWVTLQDCKIYDNTLWQPFGGEKLTFPVTVQEHPTKKGFFRVHAPYKNSDYGSYYHYTGTTPDYLYINATVANEAYFCDSKGNPVTSYNTHIQCVQNEGFQENYGNIKLECLYSHFLLKEDFKNGSQTSEYANYSGAAGSLTVNETLQTRKVKFNSGRLYSMLTNIGGSYKDGVFSGGLEQGSPGSEWELWLDGANEDESWVELGVCQYTDGFLGVYYNQAGLTVETYEVPIKQNSEKAGLYRLVAPYGNIYWPDYGTEESNQYNIDIDVSDPDYVIVDIQKAYEDADGIIQIANATALYTSGKLSDNTGKPIQYTKQQIIEKGLNDTMKDGVITISHPAIITPEGNVGWLWLTDNYPSFQPAKIVLPTSGGSNVAAKSVAAKSKRLPAVKSLRPELLGIPTYKVK